MTSPAAMGETDGAMGDVSDPLPTPLLMALAVVVGLIGGAGLCFWALRGADITWDIAAIFCL